MTNWLVALPVYNEVKHVKAVLAEVQRYASHVLVVDDGSTDGTSAVLQDYPGIVVLHHGQNLGYGAALRTAFEYALAHDYTALVTIDCDGQHQPRLIPEMIHALFQPVEPDIDILSGSRYLQEFTDDVPAPADRRRINFEITRQLNRELGFQLTDTFCGFKAYRASALAQFDITENGYAMPLQLWIQAAEAGLRIDEFAVPRIYLEEERSFGGSLDDARQRMAHYQEVIAREQARIASGCGQPLTSCCKETE